MTRQRSIVGIGEALLVETPEGVSVGGIAMDVALQAHRAGHIGVPISRIGQDPPANELLTMLTADEIDPAHIQSDPDLKTGRLVIRRLGGEQLRRLDPRAAFDNLQWDFDLEDVAQQADAAVFGLLGCRDGQARSVHDRFLSECTAAIRVCDCTNTDPDCDDNRGIALSMLRVAEVAVVDDASIRQIVPGSGDDRRDAATALLREGDLTMVAFVQAKQPIELHTAAQCAVGTSDQPSTGRVATLVAMLHGLLAGWDTPEVVRCMERVTTYTNEQPAARIPDDVLQAK